MDYKKSGVDVIAAERWIDYLKKRIQTADNNVLGGIGGYASLYALDERRVLAASTDGVGTKLILACMADKHDTIGIDLVAMNVNDLICTGAKPLFMLDYLALGPVDPQIKVDILEGILKGCELAEIALIGGESAQMNDMYPPGTYDLAGFALGIVDREAIIQDKRIKPGDPVFGLPSTGIHSNGFSLVRKVVGPGETEFISELLTPTRIYTKEILLLLDEHRHDLHGMFHITGSAYRKVFRTRQDIGFALTSFPEPPALFAELARRTKLPNHKMFETFNMGIGFLIVVAKDSSLAKTLPDLLPDAVQLGAITDNAGTVEFPWGELTIATS